MFEISPTDSSLCLPLSKKRLFLDSQNNAANFRWSIDTWIILLFFVSTTFFELAFCIYDFTRIRYTFLFFIWFVVKIFLTWLILSYQTQSVTFKFQNKEVQIYATKDTNTLILFEQINSIVIFDQMKIVNPYQSWNTSPKIPNHQLGLILKEGKKIHIMSYADRTHAAKDAYTLSCRLKLKVVGQNYNEFDFSETNRRSIIRPNDLRLGIFIITIFYFYVWF